MSVPLRSTETLSPGDVCVVAVELRDKQTGQPYWWKSFRAVLTIDSSRYAHMLLLKMHVNEATDIRQTDFVTDVVTKLEPDQWPQGVAAMHMKWTAKGLIKVAGDET